MNRRKRCIICGEYLESSREILCKTCYYAIEQLEELNEIVEDMINNEKEAPDWLIKASKRLTDLFSLSYSLYECRYVSSVILFEYLVQGSGLSLDYMVKTYNIPVDTLTKALSLLEEAKIIRVYQTSKEKIILPLRPLDYVSNRLSALAQNPQGVINLEEWGKYLTLFQFIVLLRVLRYLIINYVNKASTGKPVKKPRVIFEPFRVLSMVIIKNMERSPSECDFFDYLDEEFNEKSLENHMDLELKRDEILRLLTFLGSKKYILRYVLLSGGFLDGEAKLFVYDTKKSKAYVIKDFEDYVLYMRERLRERERKRERS